MATSTKVDQERVRDIIRSYDQARIGEVGGYESDWIIDNGKVYWADLEAGKEYRAPRLIVLPVQEFIEKFHFMDE